MAEITAERKRLVDQLKEAIEYQAKYYNWQHTPKYYKVSAKVLLSSKNIRLSQPSRKLDYHFLGLFEIIKAVGKQAYHLQLPKMLGVVHPVFHGSLLEPYHHRDGEEPPAPPLAILKESGEEYEVDEILDEHQHYGRTQYLVKWTGCPDSETS